MEALPVTQSVVTCSSKATKHCWHYTPCVPILLTSIIIIKCIIVNSAMYIIIVFSINFIYFNIMLLLLIVFWCYCHYYYYIVDHSEPIKALNS